MQYKVGDVAEAVCPACDQRTMVLRRDMVEDDSLGQDIRGPAEANDRWVCRDPGCGFEADGSFDPDRES